MLGVHRRRRAVDVARPLDAVKVALALAVERRGGVPGAGAATGVETGEVVTGVTTSFAVMEPLTAFF